jgi:hypothetical protein
MMVNEWSKPEVLPDSRPRVVRGQVWRAGSWWNRIFCANCGTAGGLVPEENMTFAFYLCQPCADKYGAIAGMTMTPDQVFWEKLKQEQMDRYGRMLEVNELIDIVAADASPLATLIKQGS